MVDVDLTKIKRFHIRYNEPTLVDNVRLVDLHCKHIIVPNEKTIEVERLSKMASEMCGMRDTIKWGVHRNGTQESEWAIINKMISDNFARPVRIFRDCYERLWADNTHSVISWVLRLGEGTPICSIPYYYVDASFNEPIVYDVNGTLSDSLNDVRTAVACVERINTKVMCGYRPQDVVWTIKDLIENLKF